MTDRTTTYGTSGGVELTPAVVDRLADEAERGYDPTTTLRPLPQDDTRVLAVGDTHGAMRWVENDVIPFAVENSCRRLMQVGDFGFVWDNDVTVVGSRLAHLTGLLEDAGLVLHFLPGNHENHPMLQSLAAGAPQSPEGHYYLTPRILYTGRYAAWEWAGVRVAAVGGATSIDRFIRVPGESWWPDEALSRSEAAEAGKLGPVEVLFSHDAPTNVPLRLIADSNSQAHRQLVESVAVGLQPKLWIHGHYHFSAEYMFRHGDFECQVRALACDYALRIDAMQVIDLADYRKA